MSIFIPSRNQRLASALADGMTQRHTDHNCKELCPELEVLLLYQNKRTFYTTSRQVPCSGMVCNLGRTLRAEKIEPMVKMGFPFFFRSEGSETWSLVKTSKEIPGPSAITPGQVTFLESLLKRNQEINEGEFQEDPLASVGTPASDSEESADEERSVGITPEGRGSYRHAYEDPFLAISAKYFQSLNPEKVPEIRHLDWGGDVTRLSEKIPLYCLGKQYSGKNSLEFNKIADPVCKERVIFKHTHWGRYLMKRIREEQDRDHKAALVLLMRKIKNFLLGLGNPQWSKRTLSIVYGNKPVRRSASVRANRFLQTLVTIDGLFAQVYLADVTAGWTWKSYDNYVLRTLDLLLNDEFLDGELPEDFPVEDIVTNYETLKKFRKSLKEAGLRGQDLPEPCSAIAYPLRNAIKHYGRVTEEHLKIQKFGILSQTRGCGTPPHLVTLKSKMKFLKTVSERPEVSPVIRQFSRAIVQHVSNKIPDEYFTGLQTKAYIHITGNACLEETRETGGTMEAVRKTCLNMDYGRAVWVYDLDDPTKSRVLKTVKDFETKGEYIFWRCLEEVLATPLELLTEASMVMISEPGKARVVTKARAALKIVLDLVNGICSHPLKKVESSASGMSKSNHGWNVFKKFYSTWKDMIFKVIDKKVTGDGMGNLTVTQTYDRVLMSCTDYEEATDRMPHKEWAGPAADVWMRKCGIPSVLRGIVQRTCFHRRKIYFSGSGPLSKYGESCPTEENPVRRFIWLERGVLMGDPLTKPLLHLLNICVREIPVFLRESQDIWRAHTDITIGMFRSFLTPAREVKTRWGGGITATAPAS